MSFSINTEKDMEVVKSILNYSKVNFVMKVPGVRRADRDDLWRQIGPQHKNDYRRTLFKIIKSYEVESIPPWAQNAEIKDLYLEAKRFQRKNQKTEKAPAKKETVNTRKRLGRSTEKKPVEKKKSSKKESSEESEEEELEEEEDELEEIIEMEDDDTTPLDPEQCAGEEQPVAEPTAPTFGTMAAHISSVVTSMFTPK